MPNKRKTALWFLLALLMFYIPASAQRNIEDRGKKERSRIQEEDRIPTEEQVLRALDEIISHGDNITTADELGFLFTGFSNYIDSIKSQKIAEKIMDIPEFVSFNSEYPQYSYQVYTLKIRNLRHFKDFLGVREYVVNCLEHQIPKVQSAAAATLLSWGEWDLAAPVICQYEAYSLFQRHKDDRAIPLLEEAVKSGSWQGRIFAAAALFYTYGDSTKYPRVALDIILNAPIDTHDENINRAKYLALQQVPRFNLVEALPGLIRMATQDTAHGISPSAVGYLVDLSGMGHQEASQALIDIRDNHPDANIREIAANGLLKIEQQQK